MTRLSTCEMQLIATEVSGLAQGADQLHYGGTKEGREAIPPMLSAIVEKARMLSNALDLVSLSTPPVAVESLQPSSDVGDVLHQAVAIKYLIENAANLDNENRGDELTTILGVLCEKAGALVETLDPPRSMAAE
ncbi:MAG: hypothetical protein AAFZ99_06650 [Pseudomonadota bacterium]